jgi:uncharacterized pyridoxamine 5'-phosphate oxidase family protein
MCIFCHEENVFYKKIRQYPELKIVPWAKGRCWVRAQPCKEVRKKRRTRNKRARKK